MDPTKGGTSQTKRQTAKASGVVVRGQTAAAVAGADFRRVSDVDACLYMNKRNCSAPYVSAWDRNHALIISFVT